MPVYRLPDSHVFPPPDHAEPDGLLAIGGDLHPDRLLLAYASGIFPWYGPRMPILWFSPDPRFVIRIPSFYVGRSIRKRVKRGDYTITMDQAFAKVIASCRTTPRPGQDGTWITADMQRAYIQLHRLGHAHSVEAWRDGELVGGLYGVAMGRMFAGESMFAHAPDASKVAFVWLVHQLAEWGFGIVDCQVHTEHLARFGAEDMPRTEFLDALHTGLDHPPRLGPWSFAPGFHPFAQEPQDGD